MRVALYRRGRAAPTLSTNHLPSLVQKTSTRELSFGWVAADGGAPASHLRGSAAVGVGVAVEDDAVVGAEEEAAPFAAVASGLELAASAAFAFERIDRKLQISGLSRWVEVGQLQIALWVFASGIERSIEVA